MLYNKNFPNKKLTPFGHEWDKISLKNSTSLLFCLRFSLYLILLIFKLYLSYQYYLSYNYIVYESNYTLKHT